jgi:hypothetical protein
VRGYQPQIASFPTKGYPLKAIAPGLSEKEDFGGILSSTVVEYSLPL